nr:ATP-binding protein [uncultured Duganella sp.]
MATPKKDKRIKVRHGVDPSYLENVLTKDITALESIFELIDNAVDAARDRLLALPDLERDKYGLPSRYDGYKVDIRLRANSLVFADNCAGIPKAVLMDRAFVIGAMSNHAYGIGRFGIGLKRALFRLGTQYRLYTDTGEFRAVMSFRDVHLKGSDLELFALQRASLGAPMTVIRISQLRDRVRHEFDAEAWRAALPMVLSKRYGRYVAKGLKISVNKMEIAPFGPGFRSYKDVKPTSESTIGPNDVSIFIDTGMHERYRIKDEKDYSKTEVGSLTDEFGWYFVCNDRIVEIATHTPNLGWKTRWHQEYYGFVGWAYFVAEDPEHLPWDTKKTTIDPHSPAFRAIADRLQVFAEDYKSKNKQAKSGTSEGTKNSGTSSTNNATNNRPTQTSTAGSGSNPSSTRGSSAAATRNAKPTAASNVHNQYWETLLPDMGIEVRNAKVGSLLAEANSLRLEQCYAGTLLYRSLMEISLFEHLKQTRSLRHVKEMHYADQAEAGRTFPDEKKKKYRPDFRTALDWLNRNDEYFPEDVRRDCTFARNKFNKHLSEMNGLAHENDLTNSSKLATIRDDTLPLLRFFLTGI